MRLLSNPRYRDAIIQGLLLAFIALIGGFFAYNASINMQRHNLPIGLDFLDRTAGFDIPFSLISWQPSDTFGRAILVGLLNTLLAFGLSVILATVAGFLFGVMRLSRNGLMRSSAAIYVEVIRNTPVLVQVIFVYMLLVQNTPPPKQSLSIGGHIFLSTRGLVFPGVDLSGTGWTAVAVFAACAIVTVALKAVLRRRSDLGTTRGVKVVWPLLLAVAIAAIVFFFADARIDPVTRTAFGFRGGGTLTPELVALVVGLSVYFSAFIAEIVRAGFLSVPAGQTEAARALALKPGQIIRLITVPLALRVVIPPLTSQYLNLLKGTSLGVAIAFPDVVQMLIGSILNRTGQAIESMGLTMGIFLVIGFLISFLMERLNRAFALVTR